MAMGSSWVLRRHGGRLFFEAAQPRSPFPRLWNSHTPHYPPLRSRKCQMALPWPPWQLERRRETLQARPSQGPWATSSIGGFTNSAQFTLGADSSVLWGVLCIAWRLAATWGLDSPGASSNPGPSQQCQSARSLLPGGQDHPQSHFSETTLVHCPQ